MIGVTGVRGFTGAALCDYLEAHGEQVVRIKSDITDKGALIDEVVGSDIKNMIHLAAVSSQTGRDTDNVRLVNCEGTRNVLEACRISGSLDRFIFASSAAIYGYAGGSSAVRISESSALNPMTPYAESKLSAEQIAAEYTDFFKVFIARPFNYTGPGHAVGFIVPKLVKAFRSKADSVVMGSTEITREFNDVRDVVEIYRRLLRYEGDESLFNICSGDGVCLRQVIRLLEELTCHSLSVEVDKQFIRENDPQILLGDPSRLQAELGYHFRFDIDSTLRSMVYSSNHLN